MSVELGPFVVGRPRVGLALGSGASRGWAHIGVLDALGEAGLPVDVVTGTSAGAVVGAYYAAGALEVLREWADSYTSSLRTISFLDISLGKGGLIEGKRFVKMMEEHLPVRTFAELNIPFGAVATDLTNMREVHLTEGALLPAVRSSVSIPGFLSPLKHKDILLVDGGLLNPVPVNLARSLGADVVIAVDLNTGEVPPPREGLTDVLNRTVETMMNRVRLMNRHYNPADLYIEPKVTDFALLDFHRSDEAIRAGYELTRSMLPEITRLFRKGISYRRRRVLVRVPDFARAFRPVRLPKESAGTEAEGQAAERAGQPAVDSGAAGQGAVSPGSGAQGNGGQGGNS